jgi:hypothetical protein
MKMIRPNDPENSMLEKVVTAIDKQFQEESGFGLTSIAYALFYHYLFKSTANTTYAVRRDHCLHDIIKSLEYVTKPAQELSRYPFFFNCLAHIMSDCSAEAVLPPALTRAFDQWNQRLAAAPFFEGITGKLGYLTGWAGVMKYFLSLPPTFAPRRQLLETYGCSVKRQLLFMHDHDLFFLPDEPLQTDMGLSQGICGVLMVMTELATYVEHECITCFISEAVARLIRLRQKVDQYENKCSFFPYRIDNHEMVAFYGNRLDWSNSDLGHALLLCRAGLLCGNEHYRSVGEIIALNSLLRTTPEHTEIRDATLARGAPGTAVLYRKLYEIIQHEDLLKGYNYWIANTITLAGEEMMEEKFGHQQADILEGLPGIGLALLGHQYGNTTDWSSIILV